MEINTALGFAIGFWVIISIIIFGPLLTSPLCQAHIVDPVQCDEFLSSHNITKFNSTTGFNVYDFEEVSHYPGARESCNYVCDDPSKLPWIYRQLNWT